MKPLLMVFRLAVSVAFVLGLTYLVDIRLPFRTTDIHMLFGIIAALCAQVVGVRLMGPQGIAGAVLALAVLALGVGLRLGWWGELAGAVGLVHLAAALGMAALIEIAAAKARREARAAA